MEFKVNKINADIRIELYDDKLIGYAIIKKDTITDFLIFEEYRNISYGRKLINYIFNYYAINYGDSMKVCNFNESTYNFFIKHGFELNDNILIIKNLQQNIRQKKAIYNASFFSFMLNIFLSLGKILIGYIFGLVSIIADGINSTADCVTNLLVVIGLKISNTPEDEEHPFGHGKIESIFSIFIGLSIIISTLGILFNNVKKLIFFHPSNIQHSHTVYFFATLFIILKILQYLYVSYIANKYNSILLKSVLTDYLADILISSSVLIGIILAAYFSSIFDIILGILITIYIIYQGAMIVYENGSILMETQDKKLLQKVRQLLVKDENIYFVHDLFMISSGKDIYIYGDVRMDDNLTVNDSHKIAENAGIMVKKNYPQIKRITLHVEPIYKGGNKWI
ncbi:cation diffusion facilitator family transporter [Caviibacter abscessus]|uniref:cation diffusion facilitator family transporter n=1 Tax=Caviibacter abscessus TaxID=1766719 RepID=UPI0008317537|nr:cation diffusion facilitator family transporter [Caviibacter abscessus]